MIKRGTLLGVLICSVSFVAPVFAQPGQSQVPARVAVVAGRATETVPVAVKKYVGFVEAINEVSSVARVSGTIKTAEGLKEGSFVHKGQLLFEIDPIPYKAKVDAAEANIDQIKARIEYAQSNYNRLADLFNKNAGSKDDMESAAASLKSYQAELKSAEAQLVLAKEDLKYSQIASEIDGRIGKKTYSDGNYVTPQSDTLCTVVQMDPIYVRFTMSMRDYLTLFGNPENLKEKSTLTLETSDGQTYEHKGVVAFNSNVAKSTTDTIKVWATFKNDSERLVPGSVVTVNLTKRDDKTAAAVEPSAVMFDGKENYVYQLITEIDDDALYALIEEDSRFKKEIDEVKKGSVSKEDFLNNFKAQRYQFKDPKTGEDVDEFANNKVDSKYMMVIRRNVELGSSNGEVEVAYSGIKPGDVIMMDGVNKARPFDLVKPVFRDKTNGDQKATQTTKTDNKERNSKQKNDAANPQQQTAGDAA